MKKNFAVMIGDWAVSCHATKQLADAAAKELYSIGCLEVRVDALV
jgi:hypothetical protein